MRNAPHMFFCDLAVADMNALSCAAHRLICHGSIHGAFGKVSHSKRKPIELSSLDVFTVRIPHLSTDPLSDEYAYDLLFINAEMYKKVWSGSKVSEAPALSKVCVQRSYTRDARAPRPKRSLLERREREFVTAEYTMDQGFDDYVTEAYRQKMLSSYRAYVVRTDKQTANLTQFLCDHSMRVKHSIEVDDIYDGKMRVTGFAKQPTHIEVRSEGSLLSRLTKRVTTRLSIR